MNKYEILKKAREENQNCDEREYQLRKGSAIVAIVTMGLVGFILMILELSFLDTELLQNGLSVLFTVVLSVQHWYLLFILKEKYYIITGVICTVSSILSILRLIDTFASMM